MSETVVNIGSLEPFYVDGDSLLDKTKNFLKKNLNYEQTVDIFKHRNVRSLDDLGDDDIEEIFNDIFYEKIFRYNDKNDEPRFYKVVLEDHDEYCDIYKAFETEDGKINFVLSYHNSGCSFGEALEEAFKKLNT